MEKRILVIGGTGMLGEPVSIQLKQSGYNVRLMVRDIDKAAKLFGNGFEKIEGDIFDSGSIERAMDGCFGVHINLSGEIEQQGVERISEGAAKLGLQRITYISGTSVAEENRWVPVIRRKFYAEKAISESGVPFTIFCPAWFMEVIPKYVRDGKAFVFGSQPNPYHFIAAEDYVGMVANSYGLAEAANKRFIIHGPEGILFHDAVKKYCEAFYPEIKKVTTMPYWLATFVAKIKGKPEMKSISDFMAAFEKIGELGDPSEANRILGSPKITLSDWLKSRLMKADS
jgi:uncharacterized protein YbjT (DUF2867 family)